MVTIGQVVSVRRMLMVVGIRRQDRMGYYQRLLSYDTYKQGDAKTAEGLFKNCKYDKTNDYLDIPAYYFMNGYGVQLGITMNGLDKIFTVDMDNDNDS